MLVRLSQLERVLVVFHRDLGVEPDVEHSFSRIEPHDECFSADQRLSVTINQRDRLSHNFIHLVVNARFESVAI